jgi:5'-nucleotidase
MPTPTFLTECPACRGSGTLPWFGDPDDEQPRFEKCCHCDGRGFVMDAEVPPAPSPNRSAIILTRSGRLLDLLNPDPNQIVIEDVGFGLARRCRFAAQCLRFYSVAEHSDHVARELAAQGAPPKIIRTGLFHDGAEYALGDWPTPLKRQSKEYLEIEKHFESVLAVRFDLEWDGDWPAEVKRVDKAILVDEVMQNMPRSSYPWPKVQPLGIKLQYRPEEEALKKFLATFELYKG